MDAASFVARVRDHYIEQFEAFAAGLRRNTANGASEVKLRLSAESEVFEHLYCVDFLRNDGATEIKELQPGSFLAFEPVALSFGKATLSIEQLHWDDVVIRHDLLLVPADGLAAWFRRWFDPDGERPVPNPALSGVIHSLIVRPGTISIDLGTAEPAAFWDMMALLENAGATTIQVGASRDGIAKAGA
jgi:hypothetical protein